jgi:hypothetical protein
MVSTRYKTKIIAIVNCGLENMTMVTLRRDEILQLYCATHYKGKTSATRHGGR